VYDISFKHALQIITRNGGRVDGDNVTIATQAIKPVRLEQGFSNMRPLQRIDIQQDVSIKEFNFEFTGTGFAISGEAGKNKDKAGEYAFDAELYVDGQKVETAKLPTSFTTRRLEIFWKYQLADKKHSVTVKVLNPNSDYYLNTSGYIVYGNALKVPNDKNK